MTPLEVVKKGFNMRLYQKRWFQAAESSNELFIPSDRGTGKTWFVREYAKHRLAKGAVLVVTATVARAERLQGISTCSINTFGKVVGMRFNTIIFDDATSFSDTVDEFIFNHLAPDGKVLAIGTEIIKSNCEAFRKFERMEG